MEGGWRCGRAPPAHLLTCDLARGDVSRSAGCLDPWVLTGCTAGLLSGVKWVLLPEIGGECVERGRPARLMAGPRLLVVEGAGWLNTGGSRVAGGGAHML